jgi:hypothetical protein
VRGEALAEGKTLTLKPVALADIRHAFAVFSFAFAAHEPIIYDSCLHRLIPRRR